MITRLAVLTITFASLAVAQTVFLVRHAERTGEPDPPLNEDGRRRARELARTLHDANIRHALVSDTIRARETAEPTAHQAGARVEILPQEDVARFVRRVRALTKRSQNTLVVGHRKTVPLIAKALGIANPPSLDAAEHDLLLVIALPPGQAPILAVVRYGGSEPSSAVTPRQ